MGALFRLFAHEAPLTGFPLVCVLVISSFPRGISSTRLTFLKFVPQSSSSDLATDYTYVSQTRKTKASYKLNGYCTAAGAGNTPLWRHCHRSACFRPHALVPWRKRVRTPWLERARARREVRWWARAVWRHHARGQLGIGWVRGWGYMWFFRLAHDCEKEATSSACFSRPSHGLRKQVCVVG